MLKKSIGLLAASILTASTHAALDAGDITRSSSAVLVLTSSTGSYVIDTGITGVDLASGTELTIDLSAASSALGTIEGYTLFGTLPCTFGEACSSFTLGYSDPGLGAIYAQTSLIHPSDLLNAFAFSDIDNPDYRFANQYINAAFSEGFKGSISGAHLTNFEVDSINGTRIGAQYIVSANTVANIFTTREVKWFEFSNETVLKNDQPLIAGIEGNNFYVKSVPTPAAAWLFGSALAGISVLNKAFRTRLLKKAQ